MTIAILGTMLIFLTGCGNETNTSEVAKEAQNIYESAQETVQNTQATIDKLEIETFNARFEAYKGERVKGASVRSLLNVVEENNLEEIDRQVELSGDVTKTTEVAMGKTYNVEFDYDSTGIINKVIITEN